MQLGNKTDQCNLVWSFVSLLMVVLWNNISGGSQVDGYPEMFFNQSMSWREMIHKWGRNQDDDDPWSFCFYDYTHKSDDNDMADQFKRQGKGRVTWVTLFFASSAEGSLQVRLISQENI